MSYMDKTKAFSSEIISALQKFILDKRNNTELLKEFVNPILREDIFNLLSRECIVLYYPLDDEDNDGFHVQMPVNDKMQHFVYINTVKRLQKQIYAAAHELGHIWTENGQAIDVHPANSEEEDALMNRFAAELLMPEEMFQQLASKKLSELQSEPGKITPENFFRVAAHLMDEYFVPFQAVVRRMSEVGLLELSTCQYIIDEFYKNNPDGEKLLEDCIHEGGYSKLLSEPNRKRSMTGFNELLNQAEKKGVFRAEKVAHLRERLNLPKVDDSGDTIEIR